ncbi:AAA family ATPase [bacterium]|nr:AAA family ATPase [bacterium]
MVSNVPSTNYLDKARNNDSTKRSYVPSYMTSQPNRDVVEIGPRRKPQKEFKPPKKSAPFDWKMALAIGGSIIAGAAMIRGALRGDVSGATDGVKEGLKNLPALKFSNLAEDKSVPKLSELTGIQNVKDRFNLIKNLLLHPDLVQNNRAASKADKSIGNSILLWGTHGTGKTTAAKGIAKELGADYFELEKTFFDSEYQSVGARNLRKVFQSIDAHAEKNTQKPIVVFMDEVDSVIANDESINGHHSKDLINVVKAEIVRIQNKRKNVIFVAATNIDPSGIKSDNRHLKLNEPILSRFKHVIEVELPDKETIATRITKDTTFAGKTESVFSKKEIENISKKLEELKVSHRNLDDIEEKFALLNTNFQIEHPGEAVPYKKHFIELLKMDENIGRDPIAKVTINNKNQIIDDLKKVLN